MTAPAQLADVLTVVEYCAWRGITKAAAGQERYRGTGPKFIKAGKSVLYRVSDLNAWLEQNARDRT